MLSLFTVARYILVVLKQALRIEIAEMSRVTCCINVIVRNNSFFQDSNGKCHTHYPKDNLKKEVEVHEEQVSQVPQDRVICSPTYLPILPHFPRVPIRIVGQVTLTHLDKYKNL